MARRFDDFGKVVNKCQRLSTHLFYIKLLIIGQLIDVNAVIDKVYASYIYKKHKEIKKGYKKFHNP